MRLIFFGLGAIGKRHAQILLKNHSYNLYAFRSGVADEKNSLGIEELHSWDEIKKIKPDIAFITNPTAYHIETAIKCAEIGCKLFIEKPIGKDLAGLDKLINLVKIKKLITYVAYNLRFHPVIEELKNYFRKYNFLHMSIIATSYYPNWRPGDAYKKRYTAKSELGGGVILDLSHEIDYSEYLLGNIDHIIGQFSKRADLTVDSEDYADILLQGDSGPANVQINFFSQKRQRIIQIDFREITIVGDLINATIEEYKNEQLILKKQLKNAYNLSYEKQIKYFFDNIDNQKMMNNLIEASNLYKKIVGFKRANE